MADLSGGEKGRLALAKLIYSNKNVLILDEPTNHLDIPSREALEAALDAFQGTIITVSHDRYFLDQIATQILSFEENKSIEIFNGNYTGFHEWKGSRRSAVSRQPEKREPAMNGGEQNDEDRKTKTKDPLSKNQRQRIESRIKEIEREIPATEQRMAQLSFQMSQPEIASNHEKLQEVSRKFEETEKQIQSLYEEWERLSEEI